MNWSSFCILILLTPTEKREQKISFPVSLNIINDNSQIIDVLITAHLTAIYTQYTKDIYFLQFNFKTSVK